jgi:hypothetical protein
LVFANIYFCREWISVTQHGNIGTPEQIWAHNDLSAQQNNMKQNAARGGHHHRIYTIYKRLSFKGCVGLLDEFSKAICPGQLKKPQSSKQFSSTEQSTLISDCNIDMHVAYTRRLRDAAITGVDVDISCNNVDINIDLSQNETETTGSSMPSVGSSFSSMLHFIAGLQHCMYKDRSFVDPLLPKDVMPQSQSPGSEKFTQDTEPPTIMEEESMEVELGPDDFLPTVNVEEEDSDESSEDEEEPDEEHDEAFLSWKKEQGMEVDTPAESTDVNSELHCESESDGDRLMSKDESYQSLSSMQSNLQSQKSDEDTPSKYKRKRKAVIVLASGAQKFEKLSFSLTLKRANVKLFLSHQNLATENDITTKTNRHCVEMLAEGFLMECIWPKPNGAFNNFI